MMRGIYTALGLLGLLANAHLGFAAEADSDPSGLVWHTDYETARSQAARERRMLLINFYDAKKPTGYQRVFQTETLANQPIQAKLSSFVLAKLPLDAQITVKGKRLTLIKHGSLTEMLGREGVAIIDWAHPKTDYYGYVVSSFPFHFGQSYRSPEFSTILDLPPGTITQRTMIFAVRNHPEKPASTQGKLNSMLTAEARQHSTHQAAITLQGHHSWDARFDRINAKLPKDVIAQEVVAESWPNEGLVEACIDCVHSWRQSPGHWGAVRGWHPQFGYDIKRGHNGIWYATGLFGLRRH